MKHNRTRVLRWSMERTRWVRSIRAWRNLLPDWTPSLDEQVALETMPHEHRAAVAVVTEDWEANDPRWDVLMALLEWERRNAREEEFLRNLDASVQPLPEPGSGLSEEQFEDAKQIIRDMKPAEPRQAIIPLKVVTSGGQTLSETTIETPIKAQFLDRLQPVRHLREKLDHARQEPTAPTDVSAARKPHHQP